MLQKPAYVACKAGRVHHTGVHVCPTTRNDVGEWYTSRKGVRGVHVPPPPAASFISPAGALILPADVGESIRPCNELLLTP